MKNLLRLTCLVCLILSAVIFNSCKKQTSEITEKEKVMGDCGNSLQMSSGGGMSVSAVNPYNIHISDLEKVGDNYVWIWEVKNPNPGNGLNGTVQDLSHWNIDLGECITLADIVEVAYSTDNKVTWTPLTKNFQEDKSQDCSSKSYLKFDYGTSGSTPTFYKIVITKNVPHVDTEAVYKSGTNTGCGVFETCGFGCPPRN